MTRHAVVPRISGGALKAVCKAAELFLAQMTERSMVAAAKSKRKTLKFSDVQQSARRDKRMVRPSIHPSLVHIHGLVLSPLHCP